MALSFIIPGLDEATSEKVIGILQERLSQEQEAALVLKHAHWNVAGPNFIAVHEMLDPQVDEVLAMADETAERIAALGGSPSGRPDDIVRFRTWPKFELDGRQNTLEYQHRAGPCAQARAVPVVHAFVPDRLTHDSQDFPRPWREHAGAFPMRRRYNANQERGLKQDSARRRNHAWEHR